MKFRSSFKRRIIPLHFILQSIHGNDYKFVIIEIVCTLCPARCSIVHGNMAVFPAMTVTLKTGTSKLGSTAKTSEIIGKERFINSLDYIIKIKMLFYFLIQKPIYLV